MSSVVTLRWRHLGHVHQRCVMPSWLRSMPSSSRISAPQSGQRGALVRAIRTATKLGHARAAADLRHAGNTGEHR